MLAADNTEIDIIRNNISLFWITRLYRDKFTEETNSTVIYFEFSQGIYEMLLVNEKGLQGINLGYQVRKRS